MPAPWSKLFKLISNNVKNVGISPRDSVKLMENVYIPWAKDVAAMGKEAIPGLKTIAIAGGGTIAATTAIQYLMDNDNDSQQAEYNAWLEENGIKSFDDLNRWANDNADTINAEYRNYWQTVSGPYNRNDEATIGAFMFDEGINHVKNAMLEDNQLRRRYGNLSSAALYNLKQQKARQFAAPKPPTTPGE